MNSQTKENDRLKSTVFSRLRKMARDGAVVMSSCRVFQTLAIATAKVLSPTVDSRHRGMASNDDDDDRRRSEGEVRNPANVTWQIARSSVVQTAVDCHCQFKVDSL